MPAPAPIEIGNRQIREALSPFAISPTEDQISKIREYIAPFAQVEPVR